MPNWPANNQVLNQFARVQVANTAELDAEFDSGDLHWLSDSELARYQAITSVPRKIQYLSGHYLLRKMASRVFGNKSHDWTYYQDAKNLRRLKCSNDSRQELFVSISHSGVWIVAAISDAPIGIDIETFSKQRDFIAIANHVFSAAEISFLESCNSKALKKNFYLHWTLKESVAKQYGAGLKFEISRNQSPVLASESEQANIQSWHCPDYVIALASEVSSKVETLGVCENAKHQRWKNVSSGK